MPRVSLPRLRVSRSARLLVCLAILLPAFAFAARKHARKKPAPPAAVVAPSPRALHAYQSAWEEIVREYRKGRYGDAAQRLERLEKLEGGDSLASLYRSVLWARSLLFAGDTLRANAVLGNALVRRSNPVAGPGNDPARDLVWQRQLHKMRVLTSGALAPAPRRELLRATLSAPLENTERAGVLYRLLALDTAVVPRTERASYLRQLIPLVQPDTRLDREYRLWVASASSVDTTWESQKLLLDLEEKLGLWSEASARAAILQAKAPGPEMAKSLQGKFALWLYNKGSYAESIQQYLAYVGRYGDTPEALIQLARAHRALSQEAPAAAWYSRLVATFPGDPLAAETLWMRAFEDEMLGNIDTALATYARIARDFPQHTRAGEALFRSGLIQFRRGNAEAAQRAFADLRQFRASGSAGAGAGVGAGRAGRLMGAARYWEGKALAGAGDAEGARAAWISLTREFPFGHYGHMARQELVRRRALPDSLEWKRLLNPATGEAVRVWFASSMASVSPTALSSSSVPSTTSPSTSSGSSPSPAASSNVAAQDTTRTFAPGFGESAWLPVSKLFTLGLDTLAVLTLQARAEAAPANLWLLYDAAVRCRTAGFGYEAYRFAMRLSDRLPVERWPDAPVEVLRLFYPPSYADLVRPAAARAGLPTALALALIKQESGFDPNAVSRVGARGLMQLMPVTGTEQARKERMAGFHPDSLFVPAVNIRLGVSYLRDVIRKQQGSIEFALAHYNAGPTALARWMPRMEGRPIEEAIEDIGYAETRDYVKRVSANYRTYQVLWEGM
jgi:soluble lytic murein transglycosylase